MKKINVKMIIKNFIEILKKLNNKQKNIKNISRNFKNK